jgi:sulfate transport system ATP-binding protein
MRIQIQDVTKRFGEFTALDRVNLDVRSGELVALLGPSGSGKTTLLRIIAGLEWPEDGQVMFDGTDALSRSVRERHVGFVFQHYALFRHMSVFENIAFGLRVRPRAQRLSEDNIREKVHGLLDLVQLKWLADRYPSQLSGGQRQRIALARALAIEPRVLLLDEPFGALDAKVRKELRRWLRNLHEDIHVTSVFVTHDQEEALEVADRVVVMDRGRIEQVGAPADVHDRPATAFVHEFIGESVVVPVTVEDRKVTLQGRPMALDAQGATNGAARLFVRPYEIDLVPAAGAALTGVVKRVHGLGAARRVEVQLSVLDALVEIDTPRSQPLAIGDTVGLKPQRYRIFADAR